MCFKSSQSIVQVARQIPTGDEEGSQGTFGGTSCRASRGQAGQADPAQVDGPFGHQHGGEPCRAEESSTRHHRSRCRPH